jgi:hypothetical protein
MGSNPSMAHAVRRNLRGASRDFGVTLVHVNVYDLMFRPLGRPEFLSASEAKIDPDDMVVAVRIGSDSRAYPIREMSYHHLVNDTVGGTPIIATY